MWPWPNDPSEKHDINLTKKQAAQRELNKALEEAQIPVQFQDGEAWIDLFANLYRVLTALVRKVYAK